MDSKEKVLSTLRALLISNGRNDTTPLRELKYDYCAIEGVKEIPTFEHRSVVDFLICSGQFIVAADSNSGLVTVREKPKSLSAHLKNNVMQQRPRPSRFTSVVNAVSKNRKSEPPPVTEGAITKRNVSADIVNTKKNMEVERKLKGQYAEHLSKPSTVFTFSQLNESLNALNAQEEVTMAYNHKKIFSTETPNKLGDHLTSQNIPGNLGQSTRYMEPTAPMITDIFSVDHYKDSFNKLNHMCVEYSKTLTCDAQDKYRTVLKIDCVKYVGEGKSSDEANENAASKYLYSIDTGEHQRRADFLEHLDDITPNSSIMKLCEMYDELNYRSTVRRGDRNMFKTIIQVDSVNYYGHGKSFQHAAANAADLCLQSIKEGIHN